MGCSPSIRPGGGYTTVNGSPKGGGRGGGEGGVMPWREGEE